jgi:hypothetical protein
MHFRTQSSNPISLRGILLVAVCLLWLPSIHAKQTFGGIAVVTSEHGSILIFDTAGESSSIHLHEGLQTHGSTITTGKGAHLYLALSNGVGIGLGENTEIIFETFEQSPYPTEKESIQHEPSVSNLSIRIVKGTVAIASNNLSPLSQFRILLSTGQLRIHSATCIVHHDALGLHLATYNGHLTYYYPESKDREFLIQPQSIRISQESAAAGHITESNTIAEMPKAWQIMAEATRNASSRVFFKSGGMDAQPKPVLMVSPDYFEQTPARPYRFSY